MLPEPLQIDQHRPRSAFRWSVPPEVRPTNFPIALHGAVGAPGWRLRRRPGGNESARSTGRADFGTLEKRTKKLVIPRVFTDALSRTQVSGEAGRGQDGPQHERALSEEEERPTSKRPPLLGAVS